MKFQQAVLISRCTKFSFLMNNNKIIVQKLSYTRYQKFVQFFNLSCSVFFIYREMGMMGSPNCMLDGMCGADLKYPNESFSPKHGGMFADPRGNIILLFHSRNHDCEILTIITSKCILILESNNFSLSY